MSAANDSLLTFRSVTFGYNRGRAALSQLSLDIPTGSVTAVLGPNGAGKTTLLHLMLGWLKPQSGQILLNGTPLSEYSPRVKSQWLGLVPQSERIPFEYSVLEFVLFGRTPYLHPLEMPSQADYQVALEVLRQVGIADLRARSLTTLSGGEKQLVLVARALAQRPRILLMDEPSNHLDLANKSRLLRLMKELQAAGVTLLLTTHEPEMATAVATHVVLMSQGRLFQSGPVEQVFTSENLSAAYELPVEVQRLDGRRIVLWN